MNLSLNQKQIQDSKSFILVVVKVEAKTEVMVAKVVEEEETKTHKIRMAGIASLLHMTVHPPLRALRRPGPGRRLPFGESMPLEVISSPVPNSSLPSSSSLTRFSASRARRLRLLELQPRPTAPTSSLATIQSAHLLSSRAARLH